ncbi:MAG: Cys-every-fifth RiPP peptide CefA [Cyanobacteria bacterium SID2]|nr:Cys-every-fifth RiPP peptide CefA [Cyanobacteria bacterium SID2]MBP0005821.1 Cys-every-fifth RiPP peptide CefA [Cyanobacteria bacterium SBC]
MQFVVEPLVSHSANAPGLDINRDRIYSITSVRSTLALTVDSQGRLVQKPWDGSERQRWIIAPNSDNTFTIQSVYDDRVIDVPGSSTSWREQLIVWQLHGGDNQKWRLTEVSNVAYKITNVNSNLVMDVRGGSIDENTPIQQFSSNGSEAQQWVLSEVLPKNVMVDLRATVYQHGNYGGASQELGLGSYNLDDLIFGNDQISSVKVPEGLRVTLFEHENFRGNQKMFTSDTPYVGNDFNDKTSGVLVEKVATLFENGSYTGKRLALGVGRYNLEQISELGNDRLSSIKIPHGLQVTVFEHSNFTGSYKVFSEDASFLGPYGFNDMASSIVVKATGIVIPKDVLIFGGTISLKTVHGRWISADRNGNLNQQPQDQSWEKFEVIRAGNTSHNSLVSYGDVVALKSQVHGKYITALDYSNNAVAQYDNLQSGEKFYIVRAGQTQSKHFVSKGDPIALQSIDRVRYLTAESGGDWNVSYRATEVKTWETFTIDTVIDHPDFQTHLDFYLSSGPCGAAACGAAVSKWSAAGVAACGAAACYADFCGAAACGAAAVVLNACGVAATGIAACAVAAAGGVTAGVTVCGAAIGSLLACGADACAAAACNIDGCGAAACGAAACGAAFGVAGACGADACGGAVCNFAACGAAAGGLDACNADACAANACAVNLCPADACVADACAIDIIPIVPFI